MPQEKLVPALKSFQSKAAAAYKNSKLISRLNAAEKKLESGFQKSRVNRVLGGGAASSSVFLQKLAAKPIKINALYSSKAISVIAEAEQDVEETEGSLFFALLRELKNSFIKAPVKTASVFMLVAIATNIALLAYRGGLNLLAFDTIAKIAAAIIFLFGLKTNVGLRTLLQTSALKKALFGDPTQESA